MSPARKAFLRIGAVVLIGGLIVGSCVVARAEESALDFLLAQKRAEASQTQQSAPMRAKGRNLRRSARSRPVLPHTGDAWAFVSAFARRYDLPQAVARAVCAQESGCRFGLTGAAGEKGPMQIKPATARMLGFRGSVTALGGPAGAMWGTLHLAMAYRKCGTASGAAKLHNAGLGASCKANAYARQVVRRM